MASGANPVGNALAIPPKRQKVCDDSELRQLVAQKSKTKRTLVDTLALLKEFGKLETATTRRELRNAIEHHGNQMTPYGTVIQRVRLGAPGLEFLDICNPFALLYYLATLSTAFGAMMYECVEAAAGLPLRLVVYADEMCPGNPYRPEKSRTLQCVYWAFADWPGHVLSRTFAWPCLCLIRSSVIEKIPGGMSYICRLLLRIFYPIDDGNSFTRGVMLHVRDVAFVVCAVFAGFLCDLKGHKENTEWKGYNGNVCCLSCANVDKRVRGVHGNIVGLDCADRDRFMTRSNESVYEDVDELLRLKPLTEPAPFGKIETKFGFNCVPNGLLLDRSIRTLFKPVEHTLRDWMHIMCSDGVANSGVGEILNAIAAFGYTLAMVRLFMSQCHLPSKYGKTHEDWLRQSRLHTHSLTSFAGTMLTLVPILYLFFLEFLGDNDDVKDLFECAKVLHLLCGILSTGPDEPMKHRTTLISLISRLHTLFVSLGFHLKPKLHHMHHIIDHMDWLGKLLACFVTERKHRDVKDAALHVMRYMEHTVLNDVVNKHCQQIVAGHDLFEKMCLVNARPNADGTVLCAKAAIVVCGKITKGDIIFLADKTCGRAEGFNLISGVFFVEVGFLPCIDGDISLRGAVSDRSSFVECADIVDSCIWHSTSRPGVLRVCVPPILLF